jgi:hypothetical protein
MQRIKIKQIYVVTSFRFNENKHGEQVIDKGRSMWFSTKNKALRFVKDYNWMEYLVEHYWSYIVIEELQEFSYKVNVIEWYRAKYMDGIFTPFEMVKLDKCPIECYKEDDNIPICGIGGL